MNKMIETSPNRRPVIVAYTGTTAFRLLRWLHPDFRHCLAIVQVPPFWIVVDSLIGRMSFAVLDLDGVAEYLVGLHRIGYRCQVTHTRIPHRKRFLPMPFSCVEAVKRTIGFDSPGVWTPRQLFQYVKRTN